MSDQVDVAKIELTINVGDTSPRKTARTDSFSESWDAAIQMSCSPNGRYVHLRNKQIGGCAGRNTFVNVTSLSTLGFERLF